MKKIFTAIVILLIANSAFSQGNFSVGSNVAGIGIGFGSSFSGYGSASSSPAITFQYEKGMWAVDGPGVISLGGFLAFKSFSDDYYAYEYKWNYTLIGVRSAYHFNMIQSTDWDVYGGLMLALRYGSFSYNGPNSYDDTHTDLYLSLFAGGRYYFSPNWAAFAELGSGIAVLNLGVTYKF